MFSANLKRKIFSRQVPQQVVNSSSNYISGLPVWAEGHAGLSPSLPACPRRSRLLPVRSVPVRGPFKGQDCHSGNHQHPEGLAAGAPEEPLPHQRREDHACYHHQDDTHTGGQRVKFLPCSFCKHWVLHMKQNFWHLRDASSCATAGWCISIARR